MSEQEMLDFSVWKARFDALDDSLNDMLKAEKFFDNPTPNTITINIRRLIEALQAFAKGQSSFFLNGFDTRAEIKRFNLRPSWEFHPQYVFEALLTQIEIDMELFRRIAHQRIMGSMVNKSRLDKADKLVWKALQAVTIGEENSDELIKKDTAVITYFQKSASIRIIPYASVALVGIPYTARTKNEDLLVIAHEVGHYVYRRGEGQVTKMAVPKALGWGLIEKEHPVWVRKWKEEIFADVFNCLIGGPLAALSSQEIALNSSRAPLGIPRPPLGGYPGYYLLYGEFTNDDGEHPVPFLRPYIYTRVLMEMGLDNWARVLEDRWNHCLNERFNLTGEDRFGRQNNDRLPTPPAPNGGDGAYGVDRRHRTFRLHNSNNDIDVGTAREVLNEVIAEILDTCLPKMKLNLMCRWSGKVDDDQIKNLSFTDETLNTLIQDVTPAEVSWPAATDLADPMAFWRAWVDREGFFPGLKSNDKDISPPPLPPVIEPGKADKLEQLEQEPMYTWIHIFHANGWTTKVGSHDGG